MKRMRMIQAGMLGVLLSGTSIVSQAAPGISLPMPTSLQHRSSITRVTVSRRPISFHRLPGYIKHLLKTQA